MPRLALALYGIFLLLAFGLRTLAHYRATGRSGWNGFSGRVGSAEWCAGLLFVIALVAGVSAPLLDWLGVVARIALLDHGFVRALGLGAYLVGLVGTLLSQWSMGNSWRIGVRDGEETELITNGPFRWVRNPIFASMLPAAFGLAALVPNWVALGGWCGLLVALEMQVRLVEEPYLLRVHGEPYRDYAGRVGRFLLRIGRLVRFEHERAS